jgi:hypothetical protein
MLGTHFGLLNALTMEVAIFSETSATINQSTQRHVPKDVTLPSPKPLSDLQNHLSSGEDTDST